MTGGSSPGCCEKQKGNKEEEKGPDLPAMTPRRFLTGSRLFRSGSLRASGIGPMFCRDTIR